MLITYMFTTHISTLFMPFFHSSQKSNKHCFEHTVLQKAHMRVARRLVLSEGEEEKRSHGKESQPDVITS